MWLLCVVFLALSGCVQWWTFYFTLYANTRKTAFSCIMHLPERLPQPCTVSDVLHSDKSWGYLSLSLTRTYVAAVVSTPDLPPPCIIQWGAEFSPHVMTASWRGGHFDLTYESCRQLNLFSMAVSLRIPHHHHFIQYNKYLVLFILFISTDCSPPPICETIWSSVLSLVSACSVFALWIHLTRLIGWTSERYKLLILIGITERR